MRLAWRPGYAIAAIVVFAIEVLIALFVDDAFVRPYLGDSLAVVLVYLGLRAVLPIAPVPAALAALGIAVVIEIGQYLHLLHALGLEHSKLARLVLGIGYDSRDLVAYAGGALAVILVERLRARTMPLAIRARQSA